MKKQDKLYLNELINSGIKLITDKETEIVENHILENSETITPLSTAHWKGFVDHPDTEIISHLTGLSIVYKFWSSL